MNPFSTPYENVLSLLGTSDAWKKYMSGLQGESLKPAYKEPDKGSMPQLKGIDFTTGKTVDLGKYWGGQNLDVSNYWNPQEAEPVSNAISPPSYQTPASPLDTAAIKDILAFQQEQTRKTRAEEMAYNTAMIPMLAPYVKDIAAWTRALDLQNTIAGQTAAQNLPNALAQRSYQYQLGKNLASDSFARELEAVSQAASRSRQDTAAAIAAGKGFGRG